MSIGTTIKKLRIARKLTQEELASHLGITSKAVSQWECDRTSPDISQIPALCHFFQISADQLLNINLPKSEEEKQTILHQYYELSRKGHLKKSWALLQEAIAKFPNDYSVMIHLSVCGDRLANPPKLHERKKNRSEISAQNIAKEYWADVRMIIFATPPFPICVLIMPKRDKYRKRKSLRERCLLWLCVRIFYLRISIKAQRNMSQIRD